MRHRVCLGDWGSRLLSLPPHMALSYTKFDMALFLSHLHAGHSLASSLSMNKLTLMKLALHPKHQQIVKRDLDFTQHPAWDISQDSGF